jgi:predicted O-methyltransferase YrrM
MSIGDIARKEKKVGKLPITKNSWGDLYRIVRSNAESNILLAALRWKVFDCLKAPVAATEAASRMESHPGNTELFLNALAGLGLIEKEKGRFVNTERSAEFLVTDSPTYIGEFFLHMNEWHQGLSMNFDSLIRNGPPEQSEESITDNDLAAKSARLSAAYQYCAEARSIASIVSKLPEFSAMKRMLDLGGGAGFFTMAVVDVHPDMRGVVFELPPVAAVSREFITKYKFDSRVSVMEGDFMTDDLGGAYDFVFAGASLNFYRHALEPLFKKIYDALRPGGVFMTHQDGLTDERTKPSYQVTEFLFGGLMGMDYGIDRGAVADAMLRVGFRSVRSFEKYSEIGGMDVGVARK